MTLPVLPPEVVVSTPTSRLLLLLPPAASALITPPLLVAAPALLPKLARRSSLNRPAATVLATVRLALSEPPTRWLATTTGLGVALPTAVLKPVPLTLTVAVPWPSTPRPEVPVPLLARLSTTLPLLAPAVAPVRPTVMACELPPAARLPMLPLALALPLVDCTAASRPSWKPAGAASVLPIVSAWLGAAPPSRKLPRFTLVGTLACATW